MAAAHRRAVDHDDLRRRIAAGELETVDLHDCDLSREAAEAVLRDGVARCGPHSPCRALVLEACAVRGTPWSTAAGAETGG